MVGSNINSVSVASDSGFVGGPNWRVGRTCH